MQFNIIRRPEWIALLVSVIISAFSCKNSERSWNDNNAEAVEVKKYFVQTVADTIDSKSDSLMSASLSKDRRIITNNQNGNKDKDVLVNLHYCHITNHVLVNILKERIANLTPNDLKRQKFVSISDGFQIHFEPIKIYPTDVNRFIKDNYYTLINDSIGVFIHCGYYDEFIRSWIDIDSAKTQKCKITIYGTFPIDYDSRDDSDWKLKRVVEVIPYVISKKDSIVPTHAQLDSIDHTNKVRNAFE